MNVQRVDRPHTADAEDSDFELFRHDSSGAMNAGKIQCNRTARTETAVA
jgi:hypothetical protein